MKMVSIKKLLPPYPYKQLSCLLKDSYAERLKAGLNFACATFDEEDLKNKLSDNAIIIGAYTESEIVGFVILNNITHRYGLRYATHEYLTIADKAKHQGIASSLLKELKNTAELLKLDFILSDTAVQAASSVKYHLKNGFLPYGYSHYPGRNYDSVNYILPISIKGQILSTRIGRKILGRFFTHH